MTSTEDTAMPSIYKRSKSVDPTAKSLKVFVKRSNERLNRIKNGESLSKIAKSQSTKNLDPQRISLISADHNSSDASHLEGNRQLLDKSDANVSSLIKGYHKERTFNPVVVEEKEKHLPEFFKEKLRLLSMYIGDDVLNTLFKSQPRMKQDEISTEEDLLGEEMIEAKDKPLIAIVRQDTYKNKLDATALAKILRTNRDIAIKILKEEHENKMKKLNDLQVEQNMNLLDDDSKVNFGEGKGPFSTFNQRSKLPKVILKPNFLSKNWFKDVIDEMNDIFVRGFEPKDSTLADNLPKTSPLKAIDRLSINYSQRVKETLEKNLNLSERKIQRKERVQHHTPFISLKEVVEEEMERRSPSPVKHKKEEPSKSYVTLNEPEIKKLMDDNLAFLNEEKVLEPKELKGVKVRYYGEPIRSKLIVISEMSERRNETAGTSSLDLESIKGKSSEEKTRTASIKKGDSGKIKAGNDKVIFSKIEKVVQRPNTPPGFKRSDSKLEPILEEVTHVMHEDSSLNNAKKSGLKSGITSRAVSRGSIENTQQQLLPKDVLYNEVGTNTAVPKYGRSKSVTKQRSQQKGRDTQSSMLPKINRLELSVGENKGESWTITKSIRGQTDKYWAHTNEQL